MRLNHPELVYITLHSFPPSPPSKNVVRDHPELVHKHPAHLASPVKRRCGTVERPQTHVEELYTPYYLCDDVVREGLRMFDALEPPKLVHKHPANPVSPVKM